MMFFGGLGEHYDSDIPRCAGELKVRVVDTIKGVAR
jgi:hypothetical protein